MKSLIVKFFIITIFISLIVSTPEKGMSISFDLSMHYKTEGMSDEIGSVYPPWVITNTSPEVLTIGSIELVPFASMNFGTLPIKSPTFYFNPNILLGYSLNQNDSIGSIHAQSFLTPPLPIPTYDVTSFHMFGFDGDYIPGAGTGYLTFGFKDISNNPIAEVKIPITFDVVSKPFWIEPDTFNTGTFSSQSPIVSEPTTMLFLISTLLSLGWVGRKFMI